MYAIFEAFDSLNDFMSAGGMVLWLIAFLAIFMWALILERIWYFNSGHKKFMKPLVKHWNGISDHSSWKASQIKDKLRSEAKEEINKHMSLIQTCVALAPLFGLLGTVTGMIEVFQVMAFTGGGDARSMAGGVSKATLPTMAGMTTALSGVFATIYLNAAKNNEENHLKELIKN
jgi:biopolymer transport protein ExbB